MNNYSKQREIILEVIKNNRTHPTAEEIYILVTKKEPKISRSTVYRNINILVEKGIFDLHFSHIPLIVMLFISISTLVCFFILLIKLSFSNL